MPLNELPVEVTRTADRTHVWLNVIMGFLVSSSIGSMPSWDTDPIFTVCRYVTYSRPVWAVTLLVATLVYTIGSFTAYNRAHRGVTIITGALLCASWYMALALCMARESYVSPREINGLWPLIVFIIALMYAHRAILYADVFTGTRWALNPFQLYSVTFLMLVSMAQVIIGVSPGSVQAQFDRGTQLSLAMANFVGAVACLVGLHLRDLEMGLWVELWAYVSLTATMAFYAFSIVAGSHGVPIATLGFALSEAFVFASLHRGIQIGSYKWALLRGNYETQSRLKPHLTHRKTEMPTVADDPSVR
jgi:hypothetical protein